MARVTEKKFAAFSVRVWRLVQRLEKLKAKAKAEGLYKATEPWPERGCESGEGYKFRNAFRDGSGSLHDRYKATFKKLHAVTKALILNY